MATQLERNTARLMLAKLKAKLNSLFEEQEAQKAATGKSQPQMTPVMDQGQAIPENKYGGMIPKAVDGLRPNPYAFGTNAATEDKFGLNVNAGLGSAFSTPTTLGQVPGGTTGYQYTQNSFANPSSFNTNVTSTTDLNNAPPKQEGVEKDWMNTAMAVAGTAPMLYNMIQGQQKPQVLNAQNFYNPYESEVRSAMRNRRFNVRPLMERNLASQNAYNANVRNLSGSRGELLSNYGAGYTGRMRMDAQALAEKQNQDNQYLGQQAQMDAQLGQARSQIKLGIQDINDRNAAAGRNYQAQSMSDLSNFAQAQQLMRNQRLSDKDKLGIIKNSDQFGYGWFEEMMKRYGITPNTVQ